MADEHSPITPLTLMQDEAVRDSFEAFKSEMPNAMLFPKKSNIRRYCLQLATDKLGFDGLFAEFGVWRGHGVNQFARILRKTAVTVTGFDSFEGLQENWSGHGRGAEKGRYGLDGILPDVQDNVVLVKGMVQDTLPAWLEAQNGTPFTFVHFDLDTYTPTAFTLAAIRDHLVEGTVLLFDELYGYPGWRNHEFKALQENLPDDSYRFVAFGEQPVGIQMTRKPS